MKLATETTKMLTQFFNAINGTRFKASNNKNITLFETAITCDEDVHDFKIFVKENKSKDLGETLLAFLQ